MGEVSDAAVLTHVEPGEARLLVAAGPPLRHHTIAGQGGITTFVAGRTLLGVRLRVAPARRRRGLARTLVRHALARGQADGCAHAVLPPAPATVPFYEQLGFNARAVPARRSYYLPPPS